MEKTKKNIIILCCSVAVISAITFCGGFAKLIETPALKIITLVAINLLNGFVAWIAMKMSGMKIDIDLKNKKQYLIGAGIAVTLSAVIAVIPAICGFSLVGGHTDFTWFSLIYNFLFYILIIGPVEEFVFRVYYQDAFMSLFKKHKWLGVVFAALLFGVWHYINGNIIQVLFASGIGLVFGFSKYKIKNCGYTGVAFGHGLYDFFNVLVRMFIA